MSKITTHVLDTVLGKPAQGIPILLEKQERGQWTEVSRETTNADGRCSNLAPAALQGRYRLTFQTADYLARLGRAGIYPEITVTFQCRGDSHYHLPLLLSDNSYTTYRGS